MLEFIIKPTINWMLVIMAKNEYEIKNDLLVLVIRTLHLQNTLLEQVISMG
ncbi:hypothetical protein HMPREF0534_1172 [Limosilactobacillus reuteri CF48-3A]|uniref:Uncharacterized protein n=1 Tax=Limosilactobacillus reuteri CF48-3A TaxID=525341 RepID=A0A8D9RZ13_LIMRT|nr:hypothetical protein HMPREF0534_1172 [Limosilactobacillus reuteri CF48-3A]